MINNYRLCYSIFGGHVWIKVVHKNKTQLRRLGRTQPGLNGCDFGHASALISMRGILHNKDAGRKYGNNQQKAHAKNGVFHILPSLC